MDVELNKRATMLSLLVVALFALGFVTFGFMGIQRPVDAMRNNDLVTLENAERRLDDLYSSGQITQAQWQVGRRRAEQSHKNLGR